MRYVKNLRTHVIHDRESLSERCNTDDIVRQDTSHDLAALMESPYRFCRHCMRGQA